MRKPKFIRPSNPSDIQLGDLVRDRLSGLTGTATAKVQYLTGCTQFGILVRPQGEVSKVPDTVYLDWQRLEYCLEGNEWADVRKSTHTRRSNGAGQPPSGQPLNHPHP